MTRLRGMLWKTPWKRNRPEVASVPVPMWFFTRFGPSGNGFTPNSDYRMPAPSPVPGDSGAPFWIGTIGLADIAGAPGITNQYAGASSGFNWGVASQFLRSFAGDPGVLSGEGGTGIGLSAQVPVLGASLRAVVTLITSVPDGFGNNTTRLYVDGVFKSQVTGPYVFAPGILSMGTPNVFGAQPGIHGWAGGNALPTPAEIQQWFLSSRYNLEIAAIPGKTSDRFSATSVAPAVPAVLPNLAGGQVMNYTVNVLPDPGALNLLVNVTFGY